SLTAVPPGAFDSNQTSSSYLSFFSCPFFWFFGYNSPVNRMNQTHRRSVDHSGLLPPDPDKGKIGLTLDQAPLIRRIEGLVFDRNLPLDDLAGVLEFDDVTTVEVIPIPMRVTSGQINNFDPISGAILAVNVSLAET